MIKRFWQNNEKYVNLGVIYTGFVLILGAYYNFVVSYNPDPEISPSMMHFVLWTLLYVPLGLFVVIPNWKVTDFGFALTRNLGLALIIIIPLFGIAGWRMQIPWQNALIEAYARTGEEIFFRGFLYALLLKIFHTKAKPWKWAIVISALLFALVHTQTFQASFLDDYGSGPVAYKVIERLFNIFLVGATFALLRYWTRSILPGAIIHSILQAGIVTLPFCMLIYAIIAFWAYIKKESDLFAWK